MSPDSVARGGGRLRLLGQNDRKICDGPHRPKRAACQQPDHEKQHCHPTELHAMSDKRLVTALELIDVGRTSGGRVNVGIVSVGGEENGGTHARDCPPLHGALRVTLVTRRRSRTRSSDVWV